MRGGVKVLRTDCPDGGYIIITRVVSTRLVVLAQERAPRSAHSVLTTTLAT